MTPKSPQKILSRVRNGAFAGRVETAERIYLSALAGSGPSYIRVAGAPGAGTSEILRYAYDRLFLEQRFVVPFYFSLSKEDGSARDAAMRFVYEFLLQAVAFRLNDPALISSSPDICELQKIAPLADAGWVKELCDSCESESLLNDANNSIRSALAAPIRAAAKGRFRVCVIVDDLHHATSIEDGSAFLEQFRRITPNAGSSIILAARRRFEIAATPYHTIEIGLPDRAASAAIADEIAGDLEVELSESVRDLVAVKSEGRPGVILSLIAAARDADIALESYRNAARVYAARIGEIGTLFELGANPAVIETLHSAGNNSFPLSALRDRVGEANVVEQMTVSEAIDVAGSAARLSGSVLLRDYLESRLATDVRGLSAEAAAANTALNFLQRSPDAMAREYRREAAVGLKDLLSTFDLQEVPRAAIDYRSFRDKYKGLSDTEVRNQILGDTNTFRLPQIVHAAEISSFAPTVAFESERDVAGVGFSDRAYRDEHKIVWIAAELDSKLEADPDLVRDTLTRLDAAAAEAGFENFRVWLVAPEGFSPGALEIISERGGLGSSRRQLNFLREAIEGVRDAADDAQVFEMTIPVGDDTELIAAHSLEEIARRFDFPSKAVNQMKTALVEACINAAEHGLSPDRKVHLKFALRQDRLTLTVSNRGLRLADKLPPQTDAAEPSADTRRGWGLGLMRSLMDDVRVEPVDDGTRIVMTKLRSHPDSR
jgi:serine/threonine-protein kinase RsbW